jgi:hypothetical protein
MKTVKQIIRYFKLRNEPNKQELAKMAYESAKEYYQNRPHTRVDAQVYQSAYIRAYRRNYARMEIARSE